VHVFLHTIKKNSPLHRPQVLLPYEGAQYPCFARAAVEHASLRLDMATDGTMDIATQLGDLVAVCEVGMHVCVLHAHSCGLAAVALHASKSRCLLDIG
jgi:hypothetical protein